MGTVIQSDTIPESSLHHFLKWTEFQINSITLMNSWTRVLMSMAVLVAQRTHPQNTSQSKTNQKKKKKKESRTEI